MQITQDLNKIKKIPEPFGRHWLVGNECEVSTKILNFKVVGACQSFQIFRQDTWFLENKRALSKCIGFCIT